MLKGSLVAAFTSAFFAFGTAYGAENNMPDSKTVFGEDLKTCPDYVKPRTFNFNNPFLADIVTRRPVTLIGDTDHAKPHLISFLAQDKIIKAWAAHGVTDIDIEINPRMHEIMAPYLSPRFDKESVYQAFHTYLEGRIFFGTEEWISLRARYMTELMELGQKYGISINFTSNDELRADAQTEFMALYGQWTKASLADCPGSEIYHQKFEQYIESSGKEKAEEYRRFLDNFIDERTDDEDRIRIMNSRNHGGRRVIVYGDLHFCHGPKNMKMRLGMDNVTHISVFLNPDDINPGGCYNSTGQQPHRLYFIETGTTGRYANSPSLSQD
ncbi:MAG: hypothetical protein LRY54_01795 [Alphaproteobacteria bacterium]|nr:hypothetical protein [Alphaproteobacteria bacterium]